MARGLPAADSSGTSWTYGPFEGRGQPINGRGYVCSDRPLILLGDGSKWRRVPQGFDPRTQVFDMDDLAYDMSTGAAGVKSSKYTSGTGAAISLTPVSGKYGVQGFNLGTTNAAGDNCITGGNGNLGAGVVRQFCPFPGINIGWWFRTWDQLSDSTNRYRHEWGCIETSAENNRWKVLYEDGTGGSPNWGFAVSKAGSTSSVTSGVPYRVSTNYFGRIEYRSQTSIRAYLTREGYPEVLLGELTSNIPLESTSQTMYIRSYKVAGYNGSSPTGAWVDKWAIWGTLPSANAFGDSPF